MDGSFIDPRKGIATIIANDFNQYEGNQLPAAADEKKMTDLFRSLQFEVVPLKNIDGHLIIDKILEAAKKGPDCFVLVVSTHGEILSEKKESRWSQESRWKHVILGNDAQPVFVDSILEKLKECDELKGKPKLLFFNVCRNKSGDDSTDIFDPGDKVPVGKNSEHTSKSTAGCDPSASGDAPQVPWDNLDLDCPEDFLIMYSVMPGKIAFGDIVEGSWLLDRMHNSKQMLKDGKTLTVYLTKVCQDVASMELDASSFNLNIFRHFLLGSIGHISKKENRKLLIDALSNISQATVEPDVNEPSKIRIAAFSNMNLKEDDDSLVKAKLKEYLESEILNEDNEKKQVIQALIKTVSPFKTSACIMHRLKENIVFVPPPQ